MGNYFSKKPTEIELFDNIKKNIIIELNKYVIADITNIIYDYCFPMIYPLSKRIFYEMKKINYNNNYIPRHPVAFVTPLTYYPHNIIYHRNGTDIDFEYYYDAAFSSQGAVRLEN